VLSFLGNALRLKNSAGAYQLPFKSDYAKCVSDKTFVRASRKKNRGTENTGLRRSIPKTLVMKNFWYFFVRKS